MEQYQQGLIPSFLIGDFTIYGITSTKTTTNRIYMSNHNTTDKEVLRCSCGHAYFEGEGCKGCYYTLRPYKLDNYCVDKYTTPSKYSLGKRIKFCKLCATPIFDKLRQKVFCSTGCRIAYNNKDREDRFCLNCKTQIEYPSRKFYFCKHECREEYNQRKKVDNSLVKFTPKRVIL